LRIQEAVFLFLLRDFPSFFPPSLSLSGSIDGKDHIWGNPSFLPFSPFSPHQLADDNKERRMAYAGPPPSPFLPSRLRTISPRMGISNNLPRFSLFSPSPSLIKSSKEGVSSIPSSSLSPPPLPSPSSPPSLHGHDPRERNQVDLFFEESFLPLFFPLGGSIQEG